MKRNILNPTTQIASKDVIAVKKLALLKVENCPLKNDCMNRSVKCGDCVDKDKYIWDYTQMV